MPSSNFFFLLFFGVLFMECASVERISVKMPGVVTSKADAYVCTHIRLTESKYIIRFEPSADMGIAHHMLMFKCKRPLTTKRKSYSCGMPCYGEGIIYAWARQAKGLRLPRGVAFDVGPKTGNPYIVLQVHYLKRIEEPDYSGVTLFTTPNPQPNVAGVFLMSVNQGMIPKRTKDFRMYFACGFRSRTTIHPFAFRTHTHSLGRTVFAEHFPLRLRDAKLLGRASPYWPQAFYNTTSRSPINKGDVLLGACVYDSTKRKRNTFIGSTHHDEMCNFYLMFYRPRGDTPLTTSELDACGDGVGIDDRPLKKLVSLIPKATFAYVSKTYSAKILKKEKSYKYEVADWLMKYKLKGQVSGVSIDSKGRLIVFHRGDRVWDGHTFGAHNILRKTYRREPIKQATILVVDPISGEVISKFGENMFYLPHGISVDAEDNLWLTDVGSHQVYKIAHNDRTKFAMVLGSKFKPGSDMEHFCKPTDVAVLNDGTFFVSDGYCNSRILKFSKSGKLLQVILSSDGNFEIPHSLTLAGQDRVCVADRERAQIECFSSKTGDSLQILKDKLPFGDAVYAINADPTSNGDVIHGVVRRARGGPKGFTLSLSSQRILSVWGPEMRLPHDIASTPTHNFVVDIGRPFRVIAFVREKKSASDSDVVTSTMSLTAKSNITTVYQSQGLMTLLSENAPFLVGIVIVFPLVVIAFGAIIVHLHKNGMCTCFFRRRTRGLRSDYKRGRFEPLLNDKDDSDSEDNDELYNVDNLKKRCDVRT